MELSINSRQILANLLESRTGQQLNSNRSWRIDTALTGILRTRNLVSIDQLVTRIAGRTDPSLSDEVIEALLNNETFFFRDRTPFDLLMNGPIRRIEQARAREKRISIWCAGCSTGQEPYSLAIAFAEDRLRWRGWTIDIVGTDVSRAAVARARAGRYSQFEVQRGLPVRQMVRWFAEQPGQEWQIARELQDMVRFEAANIIDPPPHPGAFDIILCRNVLLYFSTDMRRRAFDRLAEALRPEGALMLGAGETVLGQTTRFVSDAEHRGLYKHAAAAPQARVA